MAPTGPDWPKLGLAGYGPGSDLASFLEDTVPWCPVTLFLCEVLLGEVKLHNIRVPT